MSWCRRALAWVSQPEGGTIDFWRGLEWPLAGAESSNSGKPQTGPCSRGHTHTASSSA